MGSSDSQKQFWRDPVKRLERFNAFLSRVALKKERERHPQSARALLYENETVTNELSSPEAAHGPILLNRKRMVKHQNPEKFNAFVNAAGGVWCRREGLGNHRRQSQQSPLKLAAAFQRLIPTGERSGLPTRTATMESVSLCVRMKSWQLLSNSNQRFSNRGSVNHVCTSISVACRFSHFAG